ncbi:uncharacterized protein with FMN-binding domain [Catenulispora sp. GAS73]|uniref:FMN-binding protein n=1 Tax=Catenulispora sp. GAS73 TaxID=3156269 RepID=UPI0035158E6E
MRKTTMALVTTSAGLAVIIGAKAESAGAPKPALTASAKQPGASSHGGGAPANSTTGSSGTPSSGSSTGGAGGQPSSSPKTVAVSGSFTGSVVDTRYGPMQVQAVLSAGKLTDVTVLQQTTGGHSSQIDSYALPQLKSEAIKAQNANIDAVSGATYTSAGYAQSLQAALDAAHR